MQPMKKIKCPYCDVVSEWGKNGCPACGKFALLPGFHPDKKKKKRTFHRQRKSSVSQPWLLSSGLWNVFAGLSKLPRWVMWVGIIAVIGAYVQVSTYNFEQPEAVTKAAGNMSVLNTALDYFHKDCGRYPTTTEGLAALETDPKIAGWKGPYIQKLKWDSWRRSFCYSSDGSTFDLFSMGPDGKQGTSDDIRTTERFTPVEEKEREISVSVEDVKSLKEIPVVSPIQPGGDGPSEINPR